MWIIKLNGTRQIDASVREFRGRKRVIHNEHLVLRWLRIQTVCSWHSWGGQQNAPQQVLVHIQQRQGGDWQLRGHNLKNWQFRIANSSQQEGWTGLREQKLGRLPQPPWSRHEEVLIKKSYKTKRLGSVIDWAATLTASEDWVRNLNGFSLINVSQVVPIS